MLPVFGQRLESTARMPVREVTIAHTPDSDDAFMFYAITEGLVSSPALKIQHVLKSIQSLNEDAEKGTYEMSAISFGAYPSIADKYALMPCGACMGLKRGPIVLARREIGIEELSGLRVAVPGKQTTAYLALQICAPQVEVVVLPFDDVAPAVSEGRVDAGLVISEAQLTYDKLGLKKVVDLGEWWFDRAGLPMPLGGNIVRKDLDDYVKSELIRIFQESIRYALAHRAEAVEFAMRYARGMDFEQALKFVGTYVNELTVDYGETGRQAVRMLYEMAYECGALTQPVEIEFAGAPPPPQA
jgi:1,4-dihydroxy-6-naphthoate synthase